METAVPDNNTLQKPHALSLSDVYSEEPARQEIPPGKLKIFLGAAAGVGKTYSMLEEAHLLRESGTDIVVGYIELHVREHTERLLEGLEILPRTTVQYKNTVLEEMSTEAILLRHPQLVLIDELAHTNAPGLLHRKRYEDILEILANGISVHTTVNIQHLESLNETIYGITGRRISETFPDTLFDTADEIVLIDLPPEELRARIRQGKVYAQEKIEQALANFFCTKNLLALRELALRETADAIETSAPKRQLDTLNRVHVPPLLHTHSFVLICVALKETDARVIRQGWRFAHRMNASVEVLNLSRDDTRHAHDLQIIASLRILTKSLGIPFIEKYGDPVQQVISEAQEKRATLLVIGESTRTTWHDRLFGSFTDHLLRQLNNVDFYIVSSTPRHI